MTPDAGSLVIGSPNLRRMRSYYERPCRSRSLFKYVYWIFASIPQKYFYVTVCFLSLPLTVSAHAARVGPSFACPRPAPADVVAQMICDNAAASREELSFEQPYYALRWSRGQTAWKSLKTQAIAMDTQLRAACGFPSTGSATQTLPPNADQCYVQQAENDRTALLSELSGSALQEASRAVEQQIAIQQKLIDLGYLSNNTQADGVFGTTMRLAIGTWQRISHRPTEDGFVSDDDAKALLMASNQPNPASENTTLPVPSPETTNALKASANPSSVGLSEPKPPASEELHLFGNPDGIAYAAQKLSKWSLQTVEDEMTSRPVVKVISEQTSDSGITADITGSCHGNLFAFEIVINDTSDDSKSDETVVPLTDSALGQLASVQYRINNDSESLGLIGNEQFNNQFVPVVLTNLKGSVSDPITRAFPQFSLPGLWRVLVEFSTNRGPFIARVPIYDPAVEQAIEACRAH